MGFMQYVRSINGQPNKFYSPDGGGGNGGGNGGEGGNGGNGGEGGNGDPDKNSTDFDKLLKDDPKFKDWYTSKFGTDFSNRTKKLRDDQGNLIDADEYWKLKAADEQKKKESETEADRLKRERDDALNKVAGVEKAEKRIAVKEHAIDNGYDSKLVARLMETELDSIKLVNGSYEGIKEAIDKLAEEFPQIKAQSGGGNDGGEGGGGSYNAGDSRQRQNNNNPPNKYNKGAERAKARHGVKS